MKFTREGEVAIDVRVVAADAQSTVIRCEVRDTGIGIAKARLDALFQPFSQVDASTTRHYGGTGLGLSIVRRLVELMGGETGVESTEGAGSVFWFTARFAASQARPAEQSEHAAVAENTRVLIVDDNATNRRVLSRQAQQLGMLPTCVDGAPAARQALQASLNSGDVFELVLLDHMMPECDGFELGREIAADERYRRTRLVLLTSARGHRNAQDFADIGFAGYLLKPVGLGDLRECLVRVMSVDAAKWHLRTQPIVSTEQLCRQRSDRRILLAEDNTVNQRVACGALRKLGYGVDVVGNGAEAVAAWETGRYHLILMDCQMPEMDGYQATREIRRRESTAHRIPIVALTADAMKGTDEQCRAAGMDDYLAKPLDRVLLAETLQRHLQWRPAGSDSVRECTAPQTTSSSPRTGASPRPVLPGSAPVDWSGLMEVVDGDHALARELVGLFIASGDSLLQEITLTLAAGDLVATGRAAHSLRGASANIKARATSEAATRLEEAARAGDAALALQLAEQLRDEAGRAVAYLRSRHA